TILFGGLVQALIFGAVYLRMGFTLSWPDAQTMIYFWQVMIKFLPCVITMSVTEINFLIDQVFASSLPSGSITLINLATKYMGIILSAFSTGFSSIVFSHLSRVTTFAPKRLGFYLLESSKFMLWVTAPVTCLMWFFSY